MSVCSGLECVRDTAPLACTLTTGAGKGRGGKEHL